ncbi:MAG: amidohydrolase family protein [Truepera sp.]|nr:amidohydrolase family protein [Truepera sp.]
MLARRILAAEVVYNGLGTARADGAVVVQGEGKDAQIIAVDSLERIKQRFPEAPVTRVGFAISPPPVNAHTHLDLSRLPYFRGDYVSFIRHVIAGNRQRGLEAARDGLAELRRHGVRVVGDIVAREEVMTLLLSESDLSGVAYWEVIGPDSAETERIFNETVAKVRAFRRLERPGGVRVGLSPHTPHTVSAPLLQRLAQFARTDGLPMQIHVAETPFEAALHRTGTGPLAEFMRAFGASWQPSGLSPVGYLASLGVLEARPTLVHMVHVDDEDVRAVQRAGCAVIHCPRSNEALECGRFPWEQYAKHGVDVALGTDSLGSAPDLSLEAELSAAAALHGSKASPLALVRAAVKGGYRALGLPPPRFGRGDSASGLYFWRG